MSDTTINVICLSILFCFIIGLALGYIVGYRAGTEDTVKECPTLEMGGK
jgi:ABC-type dipeptide/oligopeptide/nickel transport system permease subunit